MKNMLEAAKAAKFSVTALTTDQKNAALEAMAQALLDNQEAILSANAMDIENATGKVPQVMLDRLLLTADPHKDPEAKLLSHVPALTEEIFALAGVSASLQGTGGMVTKLQAAKICLDSGCAMVIANGNTPENLYDILDGKPIGTLFGEVTL